MNNNKLKRAEAEFLLRFPGGMSNPEMMEMAKKHKADKMNQLAQESFALSNFENPGKIIESMMKIVGQASMVSVFEKPKFRDLCKSLPAQEKEQLSSGLKEFLHGDQEFGFELMNSLLGAYKLAKWPLLTVCPVYYRPDYEVFVKPTTAKQVIEYFELEGLKYSSKPSFAFYKAYREEINRMKALVDINLQSSNNAAFCGFLMMSLELKNW